MRTLAAAIEASASASRTLARDRGFAGASIPLALTSDRVCAGMRTLAPPQLRRQNYLRIRIQFLKAFCATPKPCRIQAEVSESNRRVHAIASRRRRASFCDDFACSVTLARFAVRRVPICLPSCIPSHCSTNLDSGGKDASFRSRAWKTSWDEHSSGKICIPSGPLLGHNASTLLLCCSCEITPLSVCALSDFQWPSQEGINSAVSGRCAMAVGETGRGGGIEHRDPRRNGD